MTLTYLFLFLVMIGHLTLDYHKLATKSIVHWISAAVVITASVIFGLLNHFLNEQQWWQFAFYSLCVHFCFFDLLWNLINKQKWYYNGDPNNPKRAWTDKVWDRVPPYAQPLVRYFVLYLGYSVYYHLDWIINGIPNLAK